MKRSTPTSFKNTCQNHELGVIAQSFVSIIAQDLIMYRFSYRVSIERLFY